MHLVPKDNYRNFANDGQHGAIRSLPSLHAQFSELFCDFRDVGAAGFALAQIPQHGRILWVQERLVALETGRPFGRGCVRFGCAMDRLALACSRNARDLLWTVEEGLRCRSLAAIVAEVWGNPKVLDFTASKRLAVRAERQGVPVFMVRYNACADLSAARRRWNVRSLPSAPHPYDAKAPGAPRWRAELFRARDIRPGCWEIEYDRTTHRLDLVSPLSDPTLVGKTQGSTVLTAAAG